MRTLTVSGAIAVLAMLIQPAEACSIGIGTPGLLALNQAGTVLRSDTLPGAPATLTVSVPSLQSITIDVAAPTLSVYPGGYNTAADTIEVSYVATSLLAGQLANRPYTSAPTSFGSGVPLLGGLAINITMNNRVVNPSGFAAGGYGTRTVVTCHP